MVIMAKSEYTVAPSDILTTPVCPPVFLVGQCYLPIGYHHEFLHCISVSRRTTSVRMNAPSGQLLASRLSPQSTSSTIR